MPELQDTKEYIAATEKKTRKRPQREKRDANYELPQPYGRAKDAHNVSRNDLSRLCKHQTSNISRLQWCQNMVAGLRGLEERDAHREEHGALLHGPRFVATLICSFFLQATNCLQPPNRMDSRSPILKIIELHIKSMILMKINLI